MRLSRILGLLFLAGISGGAYYVLQFTPLPYTAAISLLPKTLYEFEGIAGNFQTGFSARTVRVNQPGFEWTAHDVQLQHSGWSAILKSRRIEVRSITFGTAELRVKAPIQEMKPHQWTANWGERPWPISLISEVQINGVYMDGLKVLIAGSDQSFQVGVIQAVNVSLHDGHASIWKLQVHAQEGNLSVNSIGFDKAGMRLEQNAAGLVNATEKNLLSESLWTEVKLLSNESEVAVIVEAFKGKGKAKLSSRGVLTLQVIDLNPAEYFKIAAPVSKLNLSVETQVIPSTGSAEIPVAGSFSWRGLPFVYPEKPVISETGVRLAEFVVPQGRFQMGIHLRGEIGPWFELKSVPPKPLTEAVAWLYFRKALSRLNSNEKALVQQDLKFFTRGSVASPQVQAQVPSGSAPAHR